jgi:hypothetical protein
MAGNAFFFQFHPYRLDHLFYFNSMEISSMTISKFLASLLLATVCNAAVYAATPAEAPNGIQLPQGYKDWRVISSSHRTDNNTMRVIVGNDKAIDAARKGQTNPWPDGAILGKLVWKAEIDELANRNSTGKICTCRVHAQGCQKIRSYWRLGICTLVG